MEKTQETTDKTVEKDPLKDVLHFEVQKVDLPALQHALDFIENKAEKYILESTINGILKPVYSTEGAKDN